MRRRSAVLRIMKTRAYFLRFGNRESFHQTNCCAQRFSMRTRASDFYAICLHLYLQLVELQPTLAFTLPVSCAALLSIVLQKIPYGGRMSDEIDLKEKFPELTRVKAAPALFTINGCGLRLYGHRDADAETKTYVMTYCLCFIFIPIVALRAYRVSNAGNGAWYFIGKQPLSGFAKGWNMLLASTLAACICMGMWTAHTHSPEYIARKHLETANTLNEEGNFKRAALEYCVVANSRTSYAAEGQAGVMKIAQEQMLNLPLNDALAVYGLVIPFDTCTGANAEAFKRGMQLLDKHKNSDPAGSLKILTVAAPYAADAAATEKLREELLAAAITKDPADVELASQLALIYEARGELEKCEKLLASLSSKLGATEGARVLGQIYAHQEKNEEAFQLLSPYAEANLAQFHAAEKAYNNTISAVWDEGYKSLNRNLAPASFYRSLEGLSQDQKTAKADEYLRPQIQKDPRIKAAELEYEHKARIVPVALDLGIVRLRRAQAMPMGETRTKELERSEKLFLAVQGAAGQTDEFKLFCGQVKYWLGKQKEGKELFDSLLTANKRSIDTLLNIAKLYRGLGDRGEARTLSEEAYKKASNDQERYSAAGLRALAFIDLDDNIEWLKKSDTKDPYINSVLNYCLGNKAIDEGRDSDAAEHLRKVVEYSESQVKTSGSLNDGSLASLSIFRLTGDGAALKKAAGLVEAALTMQGSDSILIGNTVGALMQCAVFDTIGADLEWNTLRAHPDTALLSYYYNDEKGRSAIYSRLKQNKDYIRAMQLAEKYVILAPQSPRGWGHLTSHAAISRDTEILRELLKRMGDNDFDEPDSEERTREYYEGKRDAELLKDVNTAIKRYERMMTDDLKKKSPRSWSIAADYWVNSYIELALYRQKIDIDKAVNVAREACDLNPSSSTRGMFRSALAKRAVMRLKVSCPPLQKLDDKCSRTMAAETMLIFTSQHHPSTAAAIIADPDVQKILEMEKADFNAYSTASSKHEYLLYKLADPEHAKRVKERFQNDEFGKLLETYQSKIGKPTPYEAISKYFDAVIAGDEAPGWKIIEEVRKTGTPMPEK
jgi:tetratricopeptide (TPR) repeat protein